MAMSRTPQSNSVQHELVCARMSTTARSAGSGTRATSGAPRTRPAEALLTARLARRYYIDGVSKSDIAEEFGLSRFKVARMLEKARSSGLVRIELHYDGEIDLAL